MRASHLMMLIYDLRCTGSDVYDQDNVNMEPARIIIDIKATISMAKCNKDTVGNRHVARRYHYVWQGAALPEHNFEWILEGCWIYKFCITPQDIMISVESYIDCMIQETYIPLFFLHLMIQNICTHKNGLNIYVLYISVT